MKPVDKRLEKLEEFFANTENEPVADLLKELRAQGVDTERFSRRVNEVVESAYSAGLRALAAKEQQTSSSPSFITSAAGKTREAMLALFEQLREGAFGAQYQQAALARCRSKAAQELTDEELRSWLEDIGDTLGEPKE
jgi:hypothetical protein